MSTNPTPAERLAAADARLIDLEAERDAARMERDRLVHQFRTHRTMTDGEMAEILKGHRSWPQQIADAYPERLRRYNARSRT